MQEAAKSKKEARFWRQKHQETSEKSEKKRLNLIRKYHLAVIDRRTKAVDAINLRDKVRELRTKSLQCRTTLQEPKDLSSKLGKFEEKVDGENKSLRRRLAGELKKDTRTDDSVDDGTPQHSTDLGRGAGGRE